MHSPAVVLGLNRGQHQACVGWDFRLTVNRFVQSVYRTTEAKCLTLNCLCGAVVLVHAVPASASLGRVTGREVTVPLPG